MKTIRTIITKLGAAALMAAATATGISLADDRLALEPGQRVIIAGNTFAERMALYGYFETALHCAYPEHKLVMRNLGWSADEVDLLPRPDHTGTFEENLAWHRAEVIFLCFGMNESFGGMEKIGEWRQRLTKFVEGLGDARFNGMSAAKLVLVSPVAHEDLGAPLPTGRAVEDHNRLLESYTAVMREVAESKGLLFVDLFEPMRKLLPEGGAGGRKLTVNGIHLNELGYFHASNAMARALGLTEVAAASAGGNVEGAGADKLRRAIHEKNYFHQLCWRPLNPYYIWGGRAWCWAADRPMDELEQIGHTVRERDEAIWAAKKPPVDQVWAAAPEGPEIWETPVEYADPTLPAKGAAQEMATVRRNGARPK